MRDDVLELRFRVRRRTLLISGVATLAVLSLVAWWALSSSAEVRIGSFSSTGAGYTDDCAYADEDFWAVFAQDQDVAVVQTVRNDSRWPLEVTSLLPDVFRFGAVADDPREDAMIPDPRTVASPEAETSDRVEIPPGREVAMWVLGPWGTADADTSYGSDQGGRAGIERAPVRVRSLGIARATDIDLEKTLWVSSLPSDSDQFRGEVAQLCGA